jgi:hypothetical protein
MTRHKEIYRDKEIMIEEEDKTHLFIEGKKIHHVYTGGRYWSRNKPYVDYTSLKDLAKSIIDGDINIYEES